MENTSIDFAKIIFNAVKRNVVKGHVPDLVDTIMDDYVADGGSYGFYHSFKTLADELGLALTKTVFDEFLTDETVEEFASIWERAQERQ